MQHRQRLILGVLSLFLLWASEQSWAAPPNPTPSDAAGNTAGGSGALGQVTSGGANTAFGGNALFSTTTGNRNTAVGLAALFNNTGGDNNTATGVEALFSNTSGSANTASGRKALFSNTTGSRNTATGIEALESNTTGDNNTATGAFALHDNTTGSSNTATGVDALRNTTGSNNIGIGSGAGFNLTSGDNNIYVGNNAGPAVENNTMRLGASQTNTFIAGIFGATVGVSGTPVLVDANGQLGTIASSRRYKRDIQLMAAHTQGLYHLHPVVFRYKHDAHGERQYGLIAEEVAKVYPELVTRNAQGQIETVRYHELAPMLLNELQHQQRQLGAQAREITELKAHNARLQATVGQVQQQALQAQNARLQEMVAQQQAQNAALAARLERLEAAAAHAGALASR